MPEAWRIVKARHASTAFTGEGAARHGGRWNSRHVPVVYTSATRSLAALESLVHLNPPVLFRYVAIPVSFGEDLLTVLEPPRWPEGWRQHPPPPATQAVGDQWVRGADSAVLAVPSVIIPGEWNYLLNPRHPDFARVQRGSAEPFSFDPRLLE